MITAEYNINILKWTPPPLAPGRHNCLTDVERRTGAYTLYCHKMILSVHSMVMIWYDELDVTVAC